MATSFQNHEFPDSYHFYTWAKEVPQEVFELYRIIAVGWCFDEDQKRQLLVTDLGEITPMSDDQFDKMRWGRKDPAVDRFDLWLAHQPSPDEDEETTSGE